MNKKKTYSELDSVKLSKKKKHVIGFPPWANEQKKTQIKLKKCLKKTKIK